MVDSQKLDDDINYGEDTKAIKDECWQKNHDIYSLISVVRYFENSIIKKTHQNNIKYIQIILET